MVDFPTWKPVPQGLSDRPYHAHNRLLASVTTGTDGRRHVARAISEKLALATGPVAFILPAGGIEQWDQEGEPLHEPDALAAFSDEMRRVIKAPVELHEIEGHINSVEFTTTALAIFDRWAASGVIAPGIRQEQSS